MIRKPLNELTETIKTSGTHTTKRVNTYAERERGGGERERERERERGQPNQYFLPVELH